MHAYDRQYREDTDHDDEDHYLLAGGKPRSFGHFRTIDGRPQCSAAQVHDYLADNAVLHRLVRLCGLFEREPMERKLCERPGGERVGDLRDGAPELLGIDGIDEHDRNVAFRLMSDLTGSVGSSPAEA